MIWVTMFYDFMSMHGVTVMIPIPKEVYFPNAFDILIVSRDSSNTYYP
jgi:hypothetical protein